MLVTVLVFGVVAGGSAEPPAVMTEADSGHLVALRVGQELVLNLKSNPSTGYGWVLADTEAPVLVVLGKPAYKPGGPLPGGGGVETWTFRAAGRGAQTLKLGCRRIKHEGRGLHGADRRGSRYRRSSLVASRFLISNQAIRLAVPGDPDKILT